MPIRAMLFDFDGTLADSFSAIAASTNFVRQSCGLAELPETEVRAYVGFGLSHLMSCLVPALPPEEAVARYRQHHEMVMESQTRIFPGVASTLNELHRRGLALGICSNKAVAFTKKLVAKLGLASHMSVVLGPEDVAAPKPNPAMLLEGCRRVKVSPSEAIYVGDMSIDVRAGNAAGIPVWLVHVGLAGQEDPTTAGPCTILTSFAEILSQLEAIQEMSL